MIRYELICFGHTNGQVKPSIFIFISIFIIDIHDKSISINLILWIHFWLIVHLAEYMFLKSCYFLDTLDILILAI